MYVGQKQEPITIILLSVITCGIYGLIWYARAGKDVNQGLGREAVNTNLVWLSILCFPLIFYYLYQLDQAVVEFAGQRGVSYNSNFVLWILLSLLAGLGSFFAIFQVQTALNDAWDKAAGTPQAPYVQ
ncbi:MAG: DUF4234 domain-containing protein [Oscillospiraceae bacterium]|nr:DUF4234 domain-containing protein [Oscillospiraceae bacterium]